MNTESKTRKTHTKSKTLLYHSGGKQQASSFQN